ncbi:MAG: efflux RND transporter periplasmic adaptor subunit [Kiritimatiellae bacterium]|nr:efflux RND transporter periplasmic adaptor subunit [Kiritimatiellia bacterium]
MPKKGYSYRTAPITRTDIERSVSATGTITPRNTSSGIPVGAQVNGKLVKLYVDYNDVVTNGQIVAEIDPLVYEATYKSSLARLHETEAAVKVSECSLREREAAKLLAEKTYARKKALADKSMASVADLDAAIQVLDAATAAVESAKASLASSKASVESAQASVDQAAANLSYCTIRSPVNGIVIDRKVEEGETVVSSMNAVPVLSIAEDLDTIWVKADVPEADVGGIRVGQRVTFTVDAYTIGGRPRQFAGHVKQIRKASTTTNNVVTFPVIVEAENPEQMLFPGMTATLAIETARAENVLAVAAAAFRFRPKEEDRARISGEIERGPKLWLKADGPGAAPEYVMARQGVTDDSFTEIIAENLALLEGREAIVGYQTATLAASPESRNPFMPKPPQKTKGKAPEPKQ